MDNKFVHMGQLVRPHGINGEIVLNWYAVSHFSCPQSFWLQKKTEPPVAVTITHARNHNGRILVTIAGVDSRTRAENFRNAKLLRKREELPPLNDDEAYVCDLLGSAVLLADGTLLGHFSYVLHGTGGKIWVIAREDGTEILFPAQPEFILSLNLQDHVLTISPPEGLLELYLGEENA